MGPEVAVFLEAPRLGVKPRLAAEVGERHALRLYRVLAARTLEAIERAGLEATVWFAPPDAAATMRFWLGESRRLVPQASGDLGARSPPRSGPWSRAEAGSRSRPTAPGSTPSSSRRPPRTSREAIRCSVPRWTAATISSAACRRCPISSARCPWGGGRVLAETRARLARAGRVWRELATLRAVETAADARAEGLLT